MIPGERPAAELGDPVYEELEAGEYYSDQAVGSEYDEMNQDLTEFENQSVDEDLEDE
jgi:hypothetical protein